MMLPVKVKKHSALNSAGRWYMFSGCFKSYFFQENRNVIL